jgi:predicted dehydrogenase
MLRVAVIGAGGIGSIRANVINNDPLSQLVAVADANLNAARSLASSLGVVPYGTWNALLQRNDIDAIVVSTPTKFHSEITKAALQSGMHVLCEKPLGMTSGEIEQLCAYTPPGMILKTGFNYRHMDHVIYAKRELEKGTIGTPYFLRCRFGHGGKIDYEKDWCTNADLSGGGVLLEQGIHIFDLVRYLLGEPTSVVARINQFYWPFIGGAEDNGFCILQTAAGQTAQIHVSWTNWRNIFELEIYGRDGFMRLEGRDGHYGSQQITIGLRQPNYGRPQESVAVFGAVHPANAWTLEWAEFRNAIAENRQPNGNSFDGLQAQRLVEAACESSKTNAWVTL